MEQGIPLGKMVKDEINTVLNLKPLLQETGDLARIMRWKRLRSACGRPGRIWRIRTSRRASSFLSARPACGKTETALALADILYGGERKLVTINMSEYQEAHSVSGLKGSPPGYVGYGEGGVLTEAVRRNPYSVVLLDEVEKAHPDVLELFFQVFDKGVLDDAEGREIDFRQHSHHPDQQRRLQPDHAGLPEQAGRRNARCRRSGRCPAPVLFKSFKPAFLGRMKVVPYYPIADEVLVGHHRTQARPHP